MSSIVADELAKIKSFETDTEKRRSELTLNELNYISDKQLHKKGGGGSGPIKWDMLAVSGDPNPVLIEGDYATLREKIETARQTGVLDEPVYCCYLNKEIGMDTYYSLTGEFKSLGDDSILFEIDGHLVDLAFNSDNTLTWGEK